MSSRTPKLRRYVVRAAVIILIGAPLFILALVGLPHVVREPFLRTVAETTSRKPGGERGSEWKQTFQLATGGSLKAGNQVEVLVNGIGTFPRLWDDLRGARTSITVQMYYIQPGLVLDTTIALLTAASRRGVDVYFLYDAFGAAALTGAIVARMDSAGIRTARFRPIRWYALDRANHRNHVRGVVVDGTIGYTGGFGLDDKWLGDGLVAGEWRETNVRFTGPAALELQGVFVAKWLEATGVLLGGDALLPSDALTSLDSASAVESSLLHSPPGTGSTTIERLLAWAITQSADHIFITNAYFIPRQAFTDLLISAATRGVDVRVLTNGQATDVATTRLASHGEYGALLAAGVRIWEYQNTTVHAKTFVADAALTSIMTANFDNRSIAYNDEVAFVVHDNRTGAIMDSLFTSDLQHATEVRLADFNQRSRFMRIREWIVAKFAGML